MNYPYKTAANVCQPGNVFNITNNVYNMKDFQRLYNFRDSINYQILNFFISDLCSLPCKFFTVCSQNEYYYDIVSDLFILFSREQGQLEVNTVLNTIAQPSPSQIQILTCFMAMDLVLPQLKYTPLRKTVLEQTF